MSMTREEAIAELDEAITNSQILLISIPLRQWLPYSALPKGDV